MQAAGVRVNWFVYHLRIRPYDHALRLSNGRYSFVTFLWGQANPSLLPAHRPQWYALISSITRLIPKVDSLIRFMSDANP